MSASVRRFTLLEVLIAISIFMGLSVVLFVYSSQTTRSWTKIQARRNQFNELLAVDRTVETILPNIIPFLWPDRSSEIETDRPVIVAQANLLRCAFLHRLNDVSEGSIRFAEIAVIDNNLTVTYADRPFFDWNDVSSIQHSSVISTDVESVSFSYADFNDDNTADWQDRLFWTTEWETDDSGRLDVPLAIIMTVKWLDGSSETWFRRTMGNSYRERFGKWEPQDSTLK